MKYILIVSFLAFIETLCPNQNRPVKVPSKLKYYLTSQNTLRYAFFKFDKNRDRYLFDKTSCPYNLSEGDVSKIEKLIGQKVESYNKTATIHIKQPEKYFKQIIAITNAKGEKEVWVNCCCEVGSTWKNEIEKAHDGGRCFFQIKINLTTNTTYAFKTSGLA